MSGCSAASTSCCATDAETADVGLSSLETEITKNSDKGEDRRQEGWQNESFQHHSSCDSSKAELCPVGLQRAIPHPSPVAGRTLPILSTPCVPIPVTSIFTAHNGQSSQWAKQPLDNCCIGFPTPPKSLKKDLTTSANALVAQQASPLRQVATSLRRTMLSTSASSVMLPRDSLGSSFPAGSTLVVPHHIEVQPAYERTSAVAVLARDPQGSPLAPGPVTRPVLARDPCGKPLAHDSKQCNPLPQTPPLLEHRRLIEETRCGHQAWPVKILLPEQLMAPVKAYDPSLPLKKRPVYLEFAAAGASDSLRKLDQELPVMLQVPSFLLQDPPRFWNNAAR